MNRRILNSIGSILALSICGFGLLGLILLGEKYWSIMAFGAIMVLESGLYRIYLAIEEK